MQHSNQYKHLKTKEKDAIFDVLQNVAGLIVQYADNSLLNFKLKKTNFCDIIPL